MPTRLNQLFMRYAAQHLRTRQAGFALQDETGQTIGYLEEIEIWRDRLWVTGWALAEKIALVTTDGTREIKPSLPRLDLVRAGVTTTQVNAGFRLDLPLNGPTASICAKVGSTRYVFPVPVPATTGHARLRLLGPFLLALIAAAPAILSWRLTRDPRQRTRAKERLGLSVSNGPVPVLPDGLFTQKPAAGVLAERPPVTLIMPVYNAFELVTEALDRVRRNTDLPWHLILVEDASTDERIRPFLQDWTVACEAEEPGRVTLIENARNRGFVQCVNTALTLALTRGNHVVLLNSDALVPAGWASRLLYPIFARPRVASVTPLSNDAEIFSAPVICRPRTLIEGQVDAIDATARRLDPDTGMAEVPTGCGFCMAMNIDYLRQVPQFDSDFGRGYGEEVDWCQKTRARGGRHMATATLFVEHRSGSSFGSEQKQALLFENNAKISRRYPRYDAEVQDFIRKDALAGPRLALALALAGERRIGAVPIYLAHSMGGGAEMYLRARLDGDLATGGAAAVLRVGGNLRWRLELYSDAGVIEGTTDSFALVKALLEPVHVRRIVYSCGVGDRDPVELPGALLDLLRGTGDRLEFLFHDFFALSPSYTLLDTRGVFAGVPDAGNIDPAHVARRPDGSPVPLTRWREAWGAALAAAEELVVFSEDSATHVRTAYPEAARALVVRPHQMNEDILPSSVIRGTAGTRPVVGVLGNIGHQKGAKVVVDLARSLEKSRLARLVLIGHIDPEYALPDSVAVHGTYRVEDIPKLIVRYGITHWLIPSIWPETFSFTTREALATGLPVLCFDLGAQAEAVHAAPTGHVISLSAEGDPAGAVLDRLSELLEACE